MTLRRCDRYLLREMVGPFALALVGLLLFLLLNIVLSLTPLMVDRGIGMLTLLRLVILELPKLFVLAVPMAALFATFLALGRLMHDREIMAFESIGISLRRMLLPLIAAAAVLGVFDFAINNWAAPASERAFQRTYLEIVFRQSVPRITPNAIFSGPGNLFFYVRRYDANTKTLHDVLIYDTEGDLFPAASGPETQIVLITAETGVWQEKTWELESGRAYGMDADGKLVYSGAFDRLSIPVDQSVEQILSQSRSPDEMGISELIARVRQAASSGQRAEQYVLEIHQKISLPFATIVFVLLGGTLSFTFGARGRAVGIIASLLLITVFTGLLWWTQALGQRGAMHPALAAWLPDLLFGGLGLALFLRVDRLASRDLLKRLRRFVPFLALLGLVAVAAGAQEIPLVLDADELFVSSDRTEIRATGAVEATFENVSLLADSLHLHQAPDGQWLFEATGDVRIAIEDDLTLSGERLAAVVEVTPTGTLTRSVEAGQFRGESSFVNSAGEDHTLYFLGETGRIDFDDDGEASLIEVRRGEVTTCDCCGLPFRSQPYTLRASRFRLYPDRLLVAFGLTARAGGVPAFWLPAYVQPLEETLESPLFPAIGRSALRGWFLKWNVPFYVNERLYGSVLFDYYHAFRELGTGLVLRYAIAGHEGTIETYYFPAKVGDRIARFSLADSFDAGGGWRGGGELEYESEGADESLTFSASASGRLGDWRLTVTGARSWEGSDEDDEEEDDVVTQRLPEVSITRDPIRIGPGSVTPRISAGWITEWRGTERTHRAFRLDGGASIGIDAIDLAGFSVAPTLYASLTRYAGDAVDRTRTAVTVSVPATRGGLTIDYDGSFVTAQSPFEFDRIDVEQHVGWRIQRPGAVTVRIDGGIDLIERSLDPIDATLGWGDTVVWTLFAAYELKGARLDELVLRGAWSTASVSADWEIPFDPALARLDPIEIDITATEGRTQTSVSATLDDGGLASLAATIESRTATGWGASVSAEYEPAETPVIQNARYRLFRDIGDCIQVGIERASDQIWLYASILAFPEAILRYGTESATIEVGE